MAKNKLIWILILLCPPTATASESWFCTEAASSREGSTIQACGIGAGKDEAEARAQAFDAAKAEFDRVCQLSIDCVGHATTVEPRRTSCEQTGDSNRCHRLLVFHILPNAPSPEPIAEAKVEPKAQEMQALGSSEPRIEKGMKKSAVLATFGEPVQVVDAGGNQLIFRYVGQPFCQGIPSQSCSVVFKDNRVSHYDSFNPHNTNAFDD